MAYVMEDIHFIMANVLYNRQDDEKNNELKAFSGKFVHGLCPSNLDDKLRPHIYFFCVIW